MSIMLPSTILIRPVIAKTVATVPEENATVTAFDRMTAAQENATR